MDSPKALLLTARLKTGLNNLKSRSFLHLFRRFSVRVGTICPGRAGATTVCTGRRGANNGCFALSIGVTKISEGRLFDAQNLKVHRDRKGAFSYHLENILGHFSNF